MNPATSPRLARTRRFARVTGLLAAAAAAAMGAASVAGAAPKDAQTITFPALADVTYGEGSTPLEATASSGLAVTYAVTAGTCFVTPDRRLHFTDVGTCTVRAEQAGDKAFAPADPVDRTLTVRKATPDLTWADPAPIDTATPLSAAQLNASSTKPGTFVYDPPAGTRLPAGTDRPLTVTFTPDQATDYTQVTRTVRITVTGPAGPGPGPGTPPTGPAAADTTPPTLVPRVAGRIVLGQKGAKALPGATDAGSGVATAGCAPLDTRVAGLQKATCTATDRAGNTARKVLAYLVEYRLSAFLSPRASAAWRAGRPVPIRIRLTDAAGRPIPAAAAAALVSRSRTCRVTVASSGVQRLGRECMRYDAAGRRFTDVWTPARRPAGRVRLTVVVTYPGTTARTERSGTITLRPSR